ncbi:unnamed protein product [Nippostrongylus brasiliensis]|uniref:DUF1758 domain-containing protein n=1 Tax=Nippostrongylus brasiliensis TaxID=27835 RepID=A0A158R288_NIPBR|nr:unnamed protein product [Nippostrongylus brasiliensis]
MTPEDRRLIGPERGFLPHYLSQGHSIVMESEGQIVGGYLLQLIERPNSAYESGPDPDLPPSVYTIECIAHKLTDNTKACSRLTALLKNQEEHLRQPEGSMATNSKILIQQFQKAKIAIADGINGVEQALEKYTSEADSLSVETPSFNDIMKKVVVNSETAQDLLDNANKKLGEFLEKEYEVKNAEIQRAKTKANEAPQLALPPVPIPKFDGKIWEWETFWGAFNHSVHSRNMDDLHKMNYLLDALQGEVRNSVKQYEISRTTYPAVISYLQEKYGDKQALLDQILRRLQSAKARSSRLEDQESLCEILIALVSQLELKGEHIDNIFLQKQFLGKFSVEVQHQILREEQHRSPNTTWGSKDILAIAKAYIHAEKKIIHHIEKLEHHQTTRTEAIGRMPTSVKTKGPSAPPHSRSSRQVPSKRPPNQHDTRPKSLRKPPATKTNCVISNQEDREETVADTVLHVGSDKHQPDSLILVGQALVFNPQTQNLETVYVMLDSGADRSFVSIDLARRLRLPEKESTVLKLNTFGSATPVTKNCSTTEIKLWDREGIPHSYFVTTVDVLTEPISRNTLSPEDKGFLYGNDIVLSISPTTSKIRADLLLECADLFTLLKKDVGQQRTLPSGLKVLPSKLGYLVIGKRQPEKQDVHALFSQKANHENATTSVPSVASKTLTEERIAKQSSSTSEKSNVDTQEATAQEENDAFEDNALTIRSSSEESSDEEITRIKDTSAGIYVNNRKKEIHHISKNLRVSIKFGYVNTSTDPADCGTRGLVKDELTQHYWWSGPEFISKPQEEWQKDCKVFTLQEEHENCFLTAIRTSHTQSELVDWKRQKSLSACQNSMAYVLRFVKGIVSKSKANLRKRVERAIPEILQMTSLPYVTATEREMALNVIIKNH